MSRSRLAVPCRHPGRCRPAAGVARRGPAARGRDPGTGRGQLGRQRRAARARAAGPDATARRAERGGDACVGGQPSARRGRRAWSRSGCCGSTWPSAWHRAMSRRCGSFLARDALPGLAYGLQRDGGGVAFRLFAHANGHRLSPDASDDAMVPAAIPRARWMATTLTLEPVTGSAARAESPPGAARARAT